MPSRLLREGILDSTAVNALSYQAEVFYRRLMSVVDDFGRFDGRAPVLRGRLYPLKLDSVREADITRWIAECEKAGLIVLYAVDAKPYILFHKLGPARALASKYPAPPAGTREPSTHPFTSENNREQTFSDVPYSGSGSGSGTGSRNPCDGPAEPAAASEEPSPPTAQPKRAKKPPAQPKPRPRNPVFDAVAEVTGSDPALNGALLGKVAAALAKASPPYSPDEVREFGRRFHEFCPWAARDGRDRPTPGEVQNHLGKLRAGRYKPAPTRPTRTAADVDRDMTERDPPMYDPPAAKGGAPLDPTGAQT